MTNGETGSRNTRRLLIIGALALLFVVSFGLTLILLGGKEETSVAQRTPATQEAATTQVMSGAQEATTTKEISGAEAPSTEGTTYSIPSTGGGLEMSESRIFDSLARMVATPELVATGTVTEVLPGRVKEPETMSPEESYIDPIGNEGTMPVTIPEEEVVESGAYPTRFPQTMVRIDKVLKGGTPAKDVIPVETLELAYSRPNLEWRKPGKRVLLFAVRGRSPGVSKPLYFPVNQSQSVYVLRDSDLVATVSDPVSEPVIPLEERIASLSLPQLRAGVEQAKVRSLEAR